MDRQAALDRLRPRESELRAMGVTALSLFGSVARDEAGPESDVDLAVTLDRSRPMGLFALGGIYEHLRELLGVDRIDVATEPSEKPRFQLEIDRDRVHVF